MHHLPEYLPWSTLIKISPQGVVSMLVRGFQILFNHAPLAYNNASAVLHPGSWLQCTQADVRVHVPGMWSLLSRLLRLVTFCSSWWWSGDGLVVGKNMGPQHLVDGGSSVWYSTSEAQIQPAARDLGCGAVTTAKMPQIGGGVEMLRSWCYRAAKLPDRSRNDGCTQQGDLLILLFRTDCSDMWFDCRRVQYTNRYRLMEGNNGRRSECGSASFAREIYNGSDG